MKSLPTLASTLLLAFSISSCTSTPELPLTKNEALWTGTWKSVQYPGAKGRLAATFPKTTPINQAFNVKAKITYSPLSTYRPGHISKGTFEAFISKKGELIGSNVDKPIAVNPADRFSMKLKGNITNSEQIITYLGELNPQLTAMVGEFESDSPFNQGTFQISKAAQK